MILISHRGNLGGRNPEMENRPDYIDQAIKEASFVEVDLWVYDKSIFLGHDEATYQIDHRWLQERPTLILHAKNGQAASYLVQTDFHWFIHENDPRVVTSKKWLWCNPESPTRGGIVVDLARLVQSDHLYKKLVPSPKMVTYKSIGVAGICADYVRDVSLERYHQIHSEF